MTIVLFSPGTGPVANANERDADSAMTQLVGDLKLDDVTVAPDATYRGGDGRWAYFVCRYVRRRRERVRVHVLMPGLPIADVRYLGRPDNSLRYPRLYVDGNSWLWCYAVETIREALGEEAVL